MTAPAGGPKLAVDGLRKVFDDRRSGEVVALDGVDFEIAEKEFVTVIGTSGCGKSTLLSIIAGLEEETDGVVLVDGELRRRARARPRRRLSELHPVPLADRAAERRVRAARLGPRAQPRSRAST